MLNYTTKIPAQTSIAEISKMLARGGAKAVMYDYDDEGNIKSMNFSMVFNGNQIGFRLPANVAGISTLMEIERRKGNRSLRPWMLKKDHFHDIAWRVIKDWTEAQLALIEANQVKIEQVFLPYAITSNGQTLYEQIAANPGILLGGGNN